MYLANFAYISRIVSNFIDIPMAVACHYNTNEIKKCFTMFIRSIESTFGSHCIRRLQGKTQEIQRAIFHREQF